MSGEILCHDCLDTGWIEDRVGRSVCTCISETEPYQQLLSENERLREEKEYAEEEAAHYVDRIAALLTVVQSDLATMKDAERFAAMRWKIQQWLPHMLETWDKEVESLVIAYRERDTAAREG